MRRPIEERTDDCSHLGPARGPVTEWAVWADGPRSRHDDSAPGSQKGVRIVVGSADQADAESGVEASEPVTWDWGRFVYFADPEGNTCSWVRT